MKLFLMILFLLPLGAQELISRQPRSLVCCYDTGMRAVPITTPVSVTANTFWADGLFVFNPTGADITITLTEQGASPVSVPIKVLAGAIYWVPMSGGGGQNKEAGGVRFNGGLTWVASATGAYAQLVGKTTVN
mgnify:CR=1 FL=1